MIVLSPDAVMDIERVRSFLNRTSPGAADKALDMIWVALQRLQDFPNAGRPTANRNIRQIVVRFGAAGYILRYAIMPDSGNILVTRVWHGREHRA